MGVISGYSVDDYCIAAFIEAVTKLKEVLGAEKVTDFSDISSGDFIARIPPKIKRSEGAKFDPIVIYQITQVGNDFDGTGNLVMNEGMETDFLYFEVADCYHCDLNNGPSIKKLDEMASSVEIIEAKEIGLLEEKHRNLGEDLKGTIYKIPRERLEALIAEF